MRGNGRGREGRDIRYESLLSEKSVDDFVTGLKYRGCTDIEITKDIEKVIAERIRRYNSGKINVRWYYERNGIWKSLLNGIRNG